MNKQNPLTLVTPVNTENTALLSKKLFQLRKILDEVSSNIFQNLGTIHYARILLIEKEGHAYPSSSYLVFSTDYDGEEEQHITDLSLELSDLLDDIYSFCDGYPSPENRNANSRKDYLLKWRIKSDAFYKGAPNRTVLQIRQESKLRDYIWNMLKEPVWKNKTAAEVHKAIKENVLSNADFEWVKTKITIPDIKWGYFAIPLIALGLLGFLNAYILLGIVELLVVIIVFIGLWLLNLHFNHEKKDKPLGLTPSRISEQHILKLDDYEDLHNQNQFSQLIPMKKGKIRSLTLNALMVYARFRINVEFVKGKLMGIPTIHFARWLRIEGGNRMLFFSNFDGSWQQYLGDFIDKSGWGLTAIFSNTENFPRTRYLFWGGAYDEEHFLAWSRYYQIPTHIWYCAYPNLSIKNINNNSYIRRDLLKNLNEKKALQFLKRF